MHGPSLPSDLDRSTGAPWMFPAIAGIGLAAVAFGGITGVMVVIGLLLQIIFITFLVRHLSFVTGACRAADAEVEQPACDPGFRPPVSVLVACHDEEAVVERLVASLLALDYPHDLIQLLVVDDGSSDRTGTLLDQAAAATDRLEVLHRPAGAGGGKSGALNAALQRARGDIVVVFDADHSPAADCVQRLVRHFADPSVGLAQGRCVIGNPEDSVISRLVSVDYLAGYLVNEYGRQSVFTLPAYGGANCAVRTDLLRSLGGWNPDTVTEDTDLTLRLLLGGHRVRYDATAVDHEEGVTTLARYWKQRYRWARGHQQVCRDYRHAVVRSKRLGVAQKIETLLFLHSFHVPALGVLGFLVLGTWALGVAHPVDPFGGFVLWTLLFLGPLLELGTGLLLGDRPRRDAVTVVMFLPLFVVSMALCTKAWIDGTLGTRYGWVKTARAADRPHPAGAVS